MLVAPDIRGVLCRISSERPQFALDAEPHPVVIEMLSGLPSFIGKIIVGDPKAADSYERTHDFVFDRQGLPKFKFWVYDMRTNAALPFSSRLMTAYRMVRACPQHVAIAPFKHCVTDNSVREYEAQMLLAGFKGIVKRDNGDLGYEPFSA